MPQSNTGWDYAGNAQVGVDSRFQIIVACFVTTASNDVQQGVPLTQATQENLSQAGVPLTVDERGAVKKIPATLDTGYFSAAAVAGMEEAGFDPYVATKRQKHNQPDASVATLPLPEDAMPKERMPAKVATAAGKALYARRKAIVEPVFGPIKAARGFRRFSRRGEDQRRVAVGVLDP